MKIAVQMPSVYDQADEVMAVWERCVHASMDRVKSPGTELVLRPSSLVPNMHELGARYENDFDILRCMQEAEKEGADGIIDYCYFDPALWPARHLLNVPVVGAAESCMHLASYVGRRFAIITPEGRYAPSMEDAVEQYGFASRALSHRPVRAIGVTEEQAIVWLASGRARELADAFIPTARACIDDGADVLIVGCGVLSVVLSEGASLSEVDGVPIIGQAMASVKAVEALVSLKAAGVPFKSERGYWGSR